MWVGLISINILAYANKRLYVKKDTRFTFYRTCFYKNQNKEISPAEECLKIVNNFLLVPKGSLQVCYVDSIDIERDKNPISFDTQMCTTLLRQVYYNVIIDMGISFNKLIKNKKTLDKFKRIITKNCPSKFLLYYDNEDRKEKLLDMKKNTFAKVKEQFTKCN